MWFISLIILLFLPRGVVAVNGVCGWCGDVCARITSGAQCPDVEPPGGICRDVSGTCTVVEGDVEITLAPTRIPSPSPTIIPTQGAGVKTCSSCSTFFKRMNVSYQSNNECGTVPPTGVEVTRTYKESCQTGQEFCQRCSTSVDKQYVWWQPAAGKTCEDSPTGVTVYRAFREDCSTAVSPTPTILIGMNNCSRCSTFFNRMNVEYQSNGSCDTGPPANAIVVRSYKESCQAGQEFCQRCSTSVDKQYVWWQPAAGKTCNDTPEGVTVYRAEKEDCKACKTCIGKKYSFDKGNANCDDYVDMVDFELWKGEYLTKQGKESNFNCSQGDRTVDMVDFEIWKSNYLYINNLK